jgi:hypothetical protein
LPVVLRAAKSSWALAASLSGYRIVLCRSSKIHQSHSNRCDCRKGNPSTRHRVPERCSGDRLSTKALDVVPPRSEKGGDCPLTNTVFAGGQHSAPARVCQLRRDHEAAVAIRSDVDANARVQQGRGNEGWSASQPSSDVGAASSSSDARIVMQAPTRMTFLTRISLKQIARSPVDSGHTGEINDHPPFSSSCLRAGVTGTPIRRPTARPAGHGDLRRFRTRTRSCRSSTWLQA